jgi:hypothetical protein
MGFRRCFKRISAQENLCKPIEVKQDFFGCSLPNPTTFAIRLGLQLQPGLINTP